MSQYLHKRTNPITTLKENSKVFCAPRGLLGSWQFGQIVKVCSEPDTYLVIYSDGIFKSGKQKIEKFHASRIAYSLKPSENILTGLRVISRFLGDQYFAGTIVRADCTNGTHTVLFDDGDIIGVSHKDLRVAVQQDMKEPWNLAHMNIREDLQKYLQDEFYRARLVPSTRSFGIEEVKTTGYPQPVTYVEHECSVQCSAPPNGEDPKRYRFDPNMLKKCPPLAVPLFLGWQRKGPKYKRNGRSVFKGISVTYVSPCGRPLNSLEDLTYYLTVTKSDLPIRYFCFDSIVFPLIRYEESYYGKHFVDRSFGRENIPVHCTSRDPDVGVVPYFFYMEKSVLSEGVKIDDDPGFRVSCDCEDNCQDISKCACRSLTQTDAKMTLEGEQIGYKYQRLYAKVDTGIYECHSSCKCQKTCHNRVIQNPVEVPTEIFRTEKCGWGLRTLVDIQYGTYLFEYVGNIVDPRASKEFVGDFNIYLADMDFIEKGEQEKQGYEENYGDSEDSMEKESDEQRKSIRNYLGDSEPHTIDAYQCGNLTRFLNHSCAPNLFAQNVFVESHDPRVPHFCFFANGTIEAGDELTFDYGERFVREFVCHCKLCKGKTRKRKKRPPQK